jgi:CII-binding regulator of phage lambda lysogenization HflD
MERSISMIDQNREQNLRELLERLHNELEQTKSVDEKGNEMLRHLESDIRRRLERSDLKTEGEEPLVRRIEDTINHFESTHPNLTLTLSEMMTILCNAGI